MTSGVPLEGAGLRRKVAGRPGRRLNVIQITVESLSAKYLGCYGVNDPEDKVDYSRRGLTPNLDRISKESVWFSRVYAGGTRTVRGMEALALSIPPIPGQSVIRRTGCEALSTLGSVFSSHGYENRFIYGGDGFFDNMDYFSATTAMRWLTGRSRSGAGCRSPSPTPGAPAMRTHSPGPWRRLTVRTRPAPPSIIS